MAFNKRSTDEFPDSWYCQFWAWFVLIPLVVVVIVSFYTISLAVIGADDRVVDNYYKEGRLINVRLDEDIKAAALNMVADIHFDQSLAELVIQLHNNTQTFPDELILELSHVAEQALDHRIVLRHIAKGRYQAELDKILEHRWYLRLKSVTSNEEVRANAPERSPSRLSDADPFAKYLSLTHHWRLRGKINFSQQSSVRLTSSL
ncbi:hypothetical protein AB835_04940 [Candidatus Endobugula sertula]|uniref:Nitrogen fixation protein FixH n=1 Tax=Candidatus Endobugula sertula TaxID=62101 RepID=A0A1D2QRQ2_9GAMM|nr:hypothetical protein AB835_04940 [Candidatus Endobugula sertula]